MQTNQTKAKIKAGEAVYGCFTRYPEAGIVELLAHQGFDFITFDAEHGTIEPRDCEHMTRAAEVRGVTPLVRVPTNQTPVILRYMDVGTMGVQVPWVGTAEEAERAVQAVKYFPRGTRGMAGVRAANYAQQVPLAEYVSEANRETMVILQIESQEGVRNASEIAAVDGVDVIFIGPMDLSQSFGHPGQPGHPDVQAGMNTIIEACQANGVAFGTAVATAEAAADWRKRGARYILATIEAFLRTGARSYLQAAKG